MSDRPKTPQGCYWRGKTLYGRFVISGVEHRISLETDNPAVAAARLKAEKERIKAASKWGDDRKPFSEVIEKWFEAVSAHTGPNTVKRYLSSISTLTPYLEELYIDEIDRKAITDIIAKRRATAKKITNATIKRDLTALSSVLSFAEEEGWRDGNPALEVHRSKRLKERRDPIVLPELQDVERVIERAPGNFKHLIRAALLTGCRQDELVRLEWRAIDLRRRQMQVIGKRRKLRTIPLTDEAVALFKNMPVALKSQVVFWHGGGFPYANVASRFREFTRAVEQACQAKGVEFRRFRFHDLRHRFAVDYLRDGRGSIYTCQQIMGHESVKVTEGYLKYLTPEQAQRAKEMASGGG